MEQVFCCLYQTMFNAVLSIVYFVESCIILILSLILVAWLSAAILFAKIDWAMLHNG